MTQKKNKRQKRRLKVIYALLLTVGLIISSWASEALKVGNSAKPKDSEATNAGSPATPKGSEGVNTGNPATLRAMIEHLRVSYPKEFTRSHEFLARLAKLEKDPTANTVELEALQREVALANPLVKAQPILFVVREQYASDHHNTETIFHTGEPNNESYRPGGPLKLFNPKTGKTSVVLDPGPTGLVRDPEVHFDGRKIIFSWRKSKEENYSIYELELDPAKEYAVVPGSLRRLTNEPEATDIDPLYLPDGKIVFTSTREPKYCQCNMHIMANLNRMDGDGANIHQISKNTLFDGHPTLLPDGRVLYYRWEYVDRNFGDAQGLWTVNPDGTNHAIYWKNNMVSPAAAFDGRIIPGTDRAVCIFGSCHDRPWGALAIIDRSKGIDRKESVERIWPEKALKLVSEDGSEIGVKWDVDYFRNNLKERYEDPFPLVNPSSGKGGSYFLVARCLRPYDIFPTQKNKSPNTLRMGIYLVDTFGNEILLHEEDPGCFDPMPLAAHPRPQIIPDRRDYASATGTMYVSDVYNGTPMQNVKRGEVKWLRVVESVEKRFWTTPYWGFPQFSNKGGTISRPAISWTGYEVKRILGTVPVEADGSANFKVPAEKFVYFQLLDANKMLVATMRSGTMVQPREVLGCVGCHDNRLAAPPPQAKLMALKRAPSTLAEWYGPARTFSYMNEVQPVWDKHCVSCHDFGKPAGEKLVLARDKDLIFNASYMELFKNNGKPNQLLNTVGLGLPTINPAYSIGSHKSRLVNMLKDGHENVQLSQEEMDRIVTWIDIGGPYYADYATANPTGLAGRAPISTEQTKRLEELTGMQVINSTSNQAEYKRYKLDISFDRPELSPCLQKLDKNSAAYKEAMAIIQAGKGELNKNPTPDLQGFIACAVDQEHEKKYQRLKERERFRREALANGRKVYDPGIAPQSK